MYSGFTLAAKKQLVKILRLFPKEAQGLVEDLRAGRVDGRCYYAQGKREAYVDGPCCLIGRSLIRNGELERNSVFWEVARSVSYKTRHRDHSAEFERHLFDLSRGPKQARVAGFEQIARFIELWLGKYHK